MDTKPFTLDRTVRLCITIAIIIALLALTRELSGVLLPFVIAWFISYLLNPIVRFFQVKCKIKSRPVSVVVTLVTVVGILAALLAILIPTIGKEIARMRLLINKYMQGVEANTIISEKWQDTLRAWFSQVDLQAMISQLDLESVISKLTDYLGGLIGGSLSIFSSLAVVVVTLLYMVFIMLDYETINQGLHDMIPPKFRTAVNGLILDLEEGMNKYFRGQACIALCVGVLFSIGFLIMGLPLAVVIGLFIGLLNMIPYMQALGIPPCIVLCLIQSAQTGQPVWLTLLMMTVVFIVVQSIQDMVLTPKIMGNVTGMSPAAILLSLSIWGALCGVIGMIIALPITTLIISYYDRYVANRGVSSRAHQAEYRGRLRRSKENQR